MKVIAADLVEHPLFVGSAEFRPAALPLAVADIDSRLRRLRNMPSASDTTTERILSGANALHRMGMKWIERTIPSEPSEVETLLLSVSRARAALSMGLPESAATRLVQRISESLTPDVRCLVDEAQRRGDRPGETLAIAELVLVDRVLREDEVLRRRYLKRAYLAVDGGMQFNSTTDLVRLEPVLAWVRERLLAGGRLNLAYADVGCAAAVGAPAVCLAARRLRPGGLVRDVHGVDVEAPSPILARELLKTHHVVIYRSDPVRRSLPRQYDVILLANVHRHLNEELQESLFGHLRDSLSEDGWLFVNWRFDDRTSPCLCLRRHAAHLIPTAERNCV